MIFQPEFETLPPEELRSLQAERLKKLVHYVYERVPFYRESFDAAGVKPDDIQTIEDLQKLPFTTKQDMRDAYPFKMFAVPMEDVRRIHCSSGTTGTATVVGYTERDLQVWGECFGRFITSADCGKGSIVQVAYGYGLFTGGLGAHAGAEAVGAICLCLRATRSARSSSCTISIRTSLRARLRTHC